MSRELKSYRAIAKPITFGVNTRKGERARERKVGVYIGHQVTSVAQEDAFKKNKYNTHLHTRKLTDGDG